MEYYNIINGEGIVSGWQEEFKAEVAISSIFRLPLQKKLLLSDLEIYNDIPSVDKRYKAALQKQDSLTFEEFAADEPGTLHSVVAKMLLYTKSQEYKDRGVGDEKKKLNELLSQYGTNIVTELVSSDKYISKKIAWHGKTSTDELAQEAREGVVENGGLATSVLLCRYAIKLVNNMSDLEKESTQEFPAIKYDYNIFIEKNPKSEQFSIKSEVFSTGHHPLDSDALRMRYVSDIDITHKDFGHKLNITSSIGIENVPKEIINPSKSKSYSEISVANDIAKVNKPLRDGVDNTYNLVYNILETLVELIQYIVQQKDKLYQLLTNNVSTKKIKSQSRDAQSQGKEKPKQSIVKSQSVAPATKNTKFQDKENLKHSIVKKQISRKRKNNTRVR